MNDFSAAFRVLKKSPGFVCIAILIVALGIGAATSIFSAVNALVLRPLALPESERLVSIFETNFARNVPRFSVSYPNYVSWRERSRSFTALAALSWKSMNLVSGGEANIVTVRPMTPNLLSMLGISPAQGRGFLAEEDRPGKNTVAVITHEFWQRKLGGQSAVLGQSLILDGVSYSVIGVLPKGAFFPGNIEIAIPLLGNPTLDRRYEHELEVFGRLAPGISLEQADVEMKALASQLYADFPADDKTWSARVIPLSQDIVSPDLRKSLTLLLGAVGLLVLISCANLSNLLLLRASARSHELAVRTALGASRWRIIRHLITESLMVAAAGGLLAVLLSIWSVDILRALDLPRATEISVDGRVLAMACGITLITGFLAGLVPAMTASRACPQESLKVRSASAGRHSRLRDTMVVAQLALSLSLLIGAAMLAHSYWHLLKVNPGFATEQVLTVSLRPDNNAQAVPFYERLTQRVAALPGVSSVGLISSLPLTDGNTVNNVLPVGPTLLRAGESVSSSWRLVDGGFFAAMQIPLLRGHGFAGLSPDEARKSIVLSASLARKLFGDENPIGRQVDQLRAGNNRLTVIGVAGDVRNATLGSTPEPTFYWSMHLFLYGPMRLVVRSTGESAPLSAAIRSIAKELDPKVPMFRFTTMEEIRTNSLSRERLTLGLLGGFAVMALTLAALGTYGVIAFTVQQRTREIGVRIAVGAQTGDILRLVLGQGARLVAFGLLLGLLGAFASARLLSSLLYDTSIADPLSYLIAIIALALAAFVASLLPACKAARVDPMTALRNE